MRREVLEAAERARALIAAAEAHAAKLTSDAERAVAEIHLRNRSSRGCRRPKSRCAPSHFASTRPAPDERALDRSVELARLLAERLLGESLRVAPEQGDRPGPPSARRSARRAAHHPGRSPGRRETARVFAANARLRRGRGVQLRPDPARSRGNLRIETEIGVLDAELAPQLERLSLKLRESLSHER
ncbi:MAG: hypothetical protein WDO74_24775 [Pseudomonadota bacterium]